MPRVRTNESSLTLAANRFPATELFLVLFNESNGIHHISSIDTCGMGGRGSDLGKDSLAQNTTCGFASEKQPPWRGARKKSDPPKEKGE
jgi:hypothetical protein